MSASKSICDAVNDLCYAKDYSLVMISEDGSHKILASNLTYEDADHQLDRYCDQFPDAIIDIIPTENNV